METGTQADRQKDRDTTERQKDRYTIERQTDRDTIKRQKDRDTIQKETGERNGENGLGIEFSISEIHSDEPTKEENHIVLFLPSTSESKRKGKETE